MEHGPVTSGPIGVTLHERVAWLPRHFPYSGMPSGVAPVVVSVVTTAHRVPAADPVSGPRDGGFKLQLLQQFFAFASGCGSS
jgi:hypothetical protein